MKGFLDSGSGLVRWSNLIEHKSIVVNYGKLTYVDPSLTGMLYLDESIICLGPKCFSECKGLTKIILNDNLQLIGSYAFAMCKGLERLDIPGSVTKIGAGITIGCTSLRKLTVDPTNQNYTSEGNCVLDAGRIIAGCKESSIRQHAAIVKHAFCGIKRDRWDIYNVGSIDSEAFYGCEVEDLLISTDSTSECKICLTAFKSSRMKNVTFSGNVMYDGDTLGGATVLHAGQVMSVEFEGDIQQVAVFGGSD